MARSFISSLSKFSNIVRVQQYSFSLTFPRYDSSVLSNTNDTKKYDAKTKFLVLLITMRDSMLLLKDTNKVKNYFNQLIHSLQYVPSQNFESKKIIDFLHLNENMNANIVLENLHNIIDDVPMKKDDKLKLHTIVNNLKLLFSHWEDTIIKLELSVTRLEKSHFELTPSNIDLKSSVSALEKSNLELTSSDNSPIGEIREEVRQWRIYNWRNSQLAKLQRLTSSHADLKSSVSNLKKLYFQLMSYKYMSCVSELMRSTVRSIKKEFRKKLIIEYISENFDTTTFESLLDDPQHKEIKEFLNLDDNQIDLMLSIFDKICSKYGFSNKHQSAHYLSMASIRNEREHDMMDDYIKRTPHAKHSFEMYCKQNDIIEYYNEKDHVLLENLFTLYCNLSLLHISIVIFFLFFFFFFSSHSCLVCFLATTSDNSSLGPLFHSAACQQLCYYLYEIPRNAIPVEL
ncbi:unnamed protein product [Rotaria sordida]|uniref:Uncharacterized protein n=1 Tax=Rotaria sordida TaxID=392033 RepID=A0A820BND8_9BILA|nr:unnamed protein product [Rotaria sordida]